MRLFKRKYKDKETGKIQETKKWYLEFSDHNQIVRRWAIDSDKAVANELMRKLKIIINSRITGMPLDPTLHEWLETAPKPLRERMMKIDLLEKRYLAHTDHLLHHVNDFELSLQAKGNSDEYVKLKVNRVKAIVKGCKFATWGDISVTKIEAYLHKLRQPVGEKQGMSPQTFNFYVQAIKQFCKWMVTNGRASQSPIEHLSTLNAKVDRRHERRALSVKEMQKLLDATLHSKTRRGRMVGGRPSWEMTGLERAILYRLAMETGIRSSELRSLTKNSIVFDEGEAYVVVDAAYSKRKREDRQPLKPESDDLLRQFLTTRLDDEPLFNMPPKNNVAKLIFKPDIEAAGIGYQDG
ncbi:tyrosine-type recombinase/integrase [Planctomycetota bacterium]|nr:tyrosine-type recombinase/integrase [Planctomycetota bacterium]